ncbi:uncharacterized protein K460DRAFT_426028 [Cucurbitaria berberidis CBS 394.84]|uniref:ADF-H domain-containing protein n=1 Tax=Cucurbitaria berberidis CBS 394.84 TaxID=1168544 RepID=A0A9P4GLC8_9PLEO|nr:uncharacterized protein K460DRAFT_426028 [Cucurbitaria berberidis CBS 394.84]KAF1847314.1 hypothetical protein K460DRAFT_426028 [Cucurbitaria berberidis CBS 394.84]
MNSAKLAALNELDNVLNPRVPLYLLLRRNESLVVITYVPYLAKEDQRALFLAHRHELVGQLGEKHFSTSLICKEIGEITDARSWDERDGPGGGTVNEASEQADERGAQSTLEGGVKDMGYMKNKCRLCDRRMKNEISPDALQALETLDQSGATVQISLTTETLTLTFAHKNIPPTALPPLLPTTKPSFTFYRHPTTRLLDFIFHSPDSATVRERMTHTMAIPGLINVHAVDQGMHVDQKIEIHEPGELVFKAEDQERVGKFRSVYLRRERFEGTEVVYENMEGDKEFYDSVGGGVSLESVRGNG